jgi:cytochrome c oxidase cbb3-type subunit 3
MKLSILVCVLLTVAAAAQTPNPATGEVSPALQNKEPVGPLPGPPRDRHPMTNPYQDDPAGLTAGRRLFNSFNCSGCHGDHAGGGMGPSLRDEDWIYGGEPADIYDSITEGRAHGMPAWGVMLPPQYVWQLVSYIKSLRTPQEPDKPE